MDVGAEALGIIETHLDAYKDDDASLWPVIGLFALLSAGFLVGVGGIATVQRRLRASARRPPPIAGAESTVAMSRRRAGRAPPRVRALDRKALRTGMVDRRGDRAAQLRRGARHRRLRPGGRDRPRDGADHRLRAAQRDRGVRDRRAARRGAPVVALARPRRPGRRRADVRRRDGRLPGHERRPRAVLLRARRRRDPLRHRRDLGRRARPGPHRARALHARRRASCSASRRISSSPTAAPEPPRSARPRHLRAAFAAPQRRRSLPRAHRQEKCA